MPKAPAPAASAGEKPARVWRNRIVGYGEEAPDQLLANPANWRIHPKSQQAALEGLLSDVGFVQNIIVNKRTGYVIDGHLRVALALRRQEATIPVTYVDLSPEEEAKVLLTIDPIGGMAGMDVEKLEELLRGVTTADPGLRALLNEMADDLGLDELTKGMERELKDMPEELPGLAALKDDAVFAGNNEWGIPDLREDMLGEIPKPLRSWGGRDVCEDDGTSWWFHNWGFSSLGCPFDRMVLGFYTDDYKFDPFFDEPAKNTTKLLNAGIKLAVAPNYSHYAVHARAVRLWAVYRSRWVARYLQEAGIKLIPDLLWTGAADRGFVCGTLPKAPPAVSVQLQTLYTEQDETIAVGNLTAAVEIVQPKTMLIYGGPRAERVMEQAALGIPYTFVLNRANVRDGGRARKKKTAPTQE
jgi:hypothetical protein